MHILANLEPFRYGSPDFIQKCVQAMHSAHEGNGLHLYPQASYWDWPYTADKVQPRLLQIDRDWIWYKAWARNAWNCHRDSTQESKYWSQLLGSKFGCDTAHGKDIVIAYEEAGEISPKILRRYGITDGNRQTMTLGMLMSQLVNPARFNQIALLYNSEGPEGETLQEYAEKEWKGEPHVGETPVRVAAEIVEHGRKAVAAINQASSSVTANQDEFNRIKNDMYCQQAMANFYAEKATAALSVLRYKYSNDLSDLEIAKSHLETSIRHYTDLVGLTKDAYLYANSMQTGQRKIPVRGNDAKFKTWEELLPIYQEELKQFVQNIDSIRLASSKPVVAHQRVRLRNATVQLTGNPQRYTLAVNEPVFGDTSVTIQAMAPELEGLKGVRLFRGGQQKQGTSLTFTSPGPVKVLVGFFNSKEPIFLQAPQLEIDASANDYGQADVKIANAMIIEGMPALNIHSYSFPGGTNTLTLAKGAGLVLGFIEDKQTMPVYDAGLSSTGNRKEPDWLFE